jgi:hypothetical protein
MARFRLLMVEGWVGLPCSIKSAESRWCCVPELRLEGAKYSAFWRRVKGLAGLVTKSEQGWGLGMASGWTATSDYGAEAWLMRMVFADGRRNQDPSLRFGTTILARDNHLRFGTTIPFRDHAVGRSQAWNSLASGKRSLHLARFRVRSSSILVSSQLRDMASSLTRR